MGKRLEEIGAVPPAAPQAPRLSEIYGPAKVWRDGAPPAPPAPMPGNVMWAEGPGPPIDRIELPPPDPALGTNDWVEATRAGNVYKREQARGAIPIDPDKFETEGQKKEREELRAKLEAAGAPLDGAKPEEPATAPTAAAAAPERKAAPTGPTVIAASRDPRRNPWTKEGQERFKDAQAREGEAITQLGAIESGDAMRRAANVEETAAKLSEADDAARLAEAERGRSAAAQEAKINESLESLRTSKIDPMKGVISGDQAKDFTTVLGIVLATTAGAIGGQTVEGNTGLRMLDKLVERGIENQKADRENQRAAISGQQNMLQQMRARFGDERAAELATRIHIREAAAMKGEQMAAASGSMKAEQNAALLRAQVDQKNELDRRQLVDIPEFTPARLVGGGAAAVKPEERDRMFTTEDGKTFVAARVEDAKKIGTQQVAVRNLERLAKEIDNLRGEPEAFVPGTKKRARLEELGGQFMLATKNAEELGTLDKGVAEFAAQTFGDTTALTSRAGQRALDYAKDARKKYEDQVRAAVGEGVTRGYAATPTGPKPAAAYNGEQPKPRGAMPGSFKPGAK